MVGDIISLCEYTGCVVLDALGDVIEITEENCKNIYKYTVEHLDAVDGTIQIWTFKNMDKLFYNEQ